MNHAGIALAANRYDDLFTLLDAGEVPIDCIKCPSSPDSRLEVIRARASRPVLMHCWGAPGYSATRPTIPLNNGDHVIGLFQGMFDRNILTFNPGRDQNAQPLPTFTDVRELQRQLKAEEVALMSEAAETMTGPASIMLVDPDGNPIYIDQHV
ncbi:MAG: hypothetical protein ACO1SV_07750 [Fimbriimonas sp.]